ncbi:MAG TPA: hypothetical protein VFF67_00945 [Thermoplasmata archaeon]|nr:hypothetical protein [Thermoplasmata archaeon]
MTGAEHIHLGGGCPAPTLVNGAGNRNCDADAQYSSQIILAQLWDSSANTYTSNGGTPAVGPNLFNYTYVYNNTACSSGTCSYTNNSSAAATFPGNSVSGSFKAFFNATFTHSDRYWVILGIYIETLEFIVGYPNSTATASVNMATLGNFVQISEIKIV